MMQQCGGCDPMAACERAENLPPNSELPDLPYNPRRWKSKVKLLKELQVLAYRDAVSSSDTEVGLQVDEQQLRNDVETRTNQNKRQLESSAPMGAKRSKQEGDENPIPPHFFCVAVLTEPFRAMTPEQTTVIKDALMKDLELNIDSESTFSGKAPSFGREPSHFDGTLQFWCEDDESMEWLRTKCLSLQSPMERSNLVVKRQADLPKMIKAAIFVPEYLDSLEKLIKILYYQNRRWVDVKSWIYYTITQKFIGNNIGTFLRVGIPEHEVATVIARRKRLSYMLGVAEVRFARVQDSVPRADVELEPIANTGDGPNVSDGTETTDLGVVQTSPPVFQSIPVPLDTAWPSTSNGNSSTSAIWMRRRVASIGSDEGDSNLPSRSNPHE